MIASGPTANYSESISGPQKFYRVGLLPQPVPPPPPGLAAADKILTGPLHLETRYLLPAPGTTAEPSLDSPGAHIPEPVKPGPFQQKVMLLK